MEHPPIVGISLRQNESDVEVDCSWLLEVNRSDSPEDMCNRMKPLNVYSGKGGILATDDADLEIGLRWDRDKEAFYVNVRFGSVGGNVDDQRLLQEPLNIDIDELVRLRVDEPAYGEALTRMVLGPAGVKDVYLKARSNIAAENRKLHVRLHITAPDKYQALRWESLRDPDNSRTPIATSSNVLFSRYLSGPDWRPVPALPAHDQRALIAIAAPRGLQGPQGWCPNGRELVDVDFEKELARAQDALKSVPIVRELEGPVTLSKIMEALEKGVDILYLVCHGALIDDIPRLYLEKLDRTVQVVDGRDLVDGLSQLERRPAVVMLCSCQSASAGTEMWRGDDAELAALGPQLARAGIAAVVGMQGDISMETAKVFVPAFFTALAKHGIVDEAMAAARRAVCDKPDWWAPVLFSRLRSGRTFYVAGLGTGGGGLWQALKLQIKNGTFTPVIGPLLARGILGSRQDLARRWVRNLQLPIASHAQGDLAQVAQYQLKLTAPGTIRKQLQEHLMSEIKDRYPTLPRRLTKGPDPEQAILEVGRHVRGADKGDPYHALADLDARVYVTTGWTKLLQDALVSNGRPPDTETFRWREIAFPEEKKKRKKPSTPPQNPPTVDRPLVYHLYGHLEDLDSLVLTEDDYFLWLNSWSWAAPRGYVPSAVSKALTAWSLIFLGYRLDDWDFRVLFQSIKNSFGGSGLLQNNQHVAVQLDRESQTIEPEAVQQYLERYFGKDNVSIYWDDPRQFLMEMRERNLIQGRRPS